MGQPSRAITAVLHIDLAAVAENYRLACRLAGHARVAAVVKSDAYGLGIEHVTQCLADAGCRRFLVTSLAEADCVRRVARDATVMVLQAGLDEPFPSTAPLGLLPVANSIDCIRDLAGHHRPYVLNVESGFSRLGVSFDGLRRLALTGFLRDHPPSMIMTHLACSETPAAPANLIQKQRFAAACTLLPKVPASLGASATLWLDASWHLDMVRIGSALYGLNNARIEPNPLASVIRLSAEVLECQTVPRGEIVGYAGTFRTDRETRLAILGIGYANGFPWSAANRIALDIGGYRAPIVGRVSMEYTTIDVTDVPLALCHRGMWLDLLHDHVDADRLGDAVGVNGQEILTRLGKGCYRDYHQTGAVRGDGNDGPA